MTSIPSNSKRLFLEKKTDMILDSMDKITKKIIIQFKFGSERHWRMTGIIIIHKHPIKMWKISGKSDVNVSNAFEIRSYSGRK